MNVIDAIKKRASIRAFLNKTVEPKLLEKIFDAARYAPSDKNTQPWHVAVVVNDTKQAIAEKLSALNAAQVMPNPDFAADENLPELYKNRAFECGVALYSALNISRDDKQKRVTQWQKNFRFFDAPVALFFFVDDSLGANAWVDCGMFIQTVMLAAMEYGLATCPQRSAAQYPDAIREILGKTYQNKKLLTAMAVGYPDNTAPENNYRTARAATGEFVEFFY